MNRAYNNAQNNTSWFGMELSYDYGFDEVQYNGNIAGARWRSKGDGEQRAFGYGYDNANRLLRADFTQNNGGWNQAAGLNFNVKMGDGINHTSAYDENGNIKGMQQWGAKLNSSVQIDNLSYSYNSSSNKLQAVTDAIAADQKLGDFTDKNGSNNDYSYDNNGNLTQDLNKDISTITYNHLNLPYLINVTGKGTIKYIYDAVGNKLEKRTVETSPTSKTTTTTYLSGAVYQNDSLQFIGHEEGRVRAVRESGSPEVRYVYDYFIKDHLGNTRVVLTDEQKTDAYPVASLEAATINNEKLYYNIPDDGATRVNKNTVAGYPTDSYTNPNDYVQKLNGNGTKIGTSITLKVMSGDSYNLRANSWYRNNGASPSSPVSPLNSIITALSNGIVGTGATKVTAAALQSSNTLDPAITNFLNNQTNITTRPKAYVNWVLLDEQFKYVSGGYEQVGDNEEFKTHIRSNLPITRNGYLYVYVSNETPNIDVFFDNVQITHIRGPLLSEDHYYPFGGRLASISSSSAGSLINKYKFGGKELNSNEFSDGSGMELYDFHARNYDPQIGRWHSLDPKAEGRDWLTPYNYVQNNPLLRIDPDGMFDFVKDGRGNIRWDNSANSQATTKEGETYLGKTLTFKFTSYIDKKTWDGPNPPGGDASGVKLTTTVNVTGNENEKGELTSVSAGKNVEVGSTPIGTGRDSYPGLGDGQNKFSLTTASNGVNLNMEQHGSVSPIEQIGMNVMGFKIVNVAQKLDINISPRGNVTTSAATDVFPSATLTVNGSNLMQYNQPSFVKTHRAPVTDVTQGRFNGNTYFPGKVSHDVSYKPAMWYKRL